MTGRVAELNSRMGSMLTKSADVSSKSSASDSFQKVMDQTGKRDDAANAQAKSETETVKQTSKISSSEDAGRRKETAVKDAAAKKEAENEESVKPAEDLKEELEKISSQTTLAVMEILNVSAEEITLAMESLGLEKTDILNKNSLSSLVAELTADGDVSALLTDSELYGKLKEVTGEVQALTKEILEQFSMTPEEFDAALKTAVSETIPEESSPMVMEQPEEVAAEEESAPKIIVKDMMQEEGSTKDSSVTKENGEQIILEKSVSSIPQKAAEKEQNPQGGFQGNTDAQLFGQNPQPLDTENYIQESPDFPRVDTEDIMRQITEQIRITLKPETTVMEMELNPASLGRVSVHLEAKNGVITAQFAAQNEAVKEAIESQAVQLRETLESQGVKVDAVEVTIASHEFERNLQQNSGGDREEKEKNAGSVSRRKIHLNRLEEGDEELSEEEELAKQIMIQNGNTVDYTA